MSNLYHGSESLFWLNYNLIHKNNADYYYVCRDRVPVIRIHYLIQQVLRSWFSQLICMKHKRKIDQFQLGMWVFKHLHPHLFAPTCLAFASYANAPIHKMARWFSHILQYVFKMKGIRCKYFDGWFLLSHTEKEREIDYVMRKRMGAVTHFKICNKLLLSTASKLTHTHRKCTRNVMAIYECFVLPVGSSQPFHWVVSCLYFYHCLNINGKSQWRLFVWKCAKQT